MCFAFIFFLVDLKGTVVGGIRKEKEKPGFQSERTQGEGRMIIKNRQWRSKRLFKHNLQSSQKEFKAAS